MVDALKQANFDFDSVPIIEVWNKTDLLSGKDGLNALKTRLEKSNGEVTMGDKKWDGAALPQPDNKYLNPNHSQESSTPYATIPVSALNNEGIDALLQTLELSFRQVKKLKRVKFAHHIESSGLITQFLQQQLHVMTSNKMNGMVSPCGTKIGHILWASKGEEESLRNYLRMLESGPRKEDYYRKQDISYDNNDRQSCEHDYDIDSDEERFSSGKRQKTSTKPGKRKMLRN